MLEEIGFKYNVNTIDLNKGDQFKPEFKKISPFSKIPVIKDSDNNEVVFESGAILIYLAEKRSITLFCLIFLINLLMQL